LPILRGGSKYLGGEQTSPPIGEATAFHALENVGGAVGIALVLRGIAKVELGKVTVNVLRRPVMVGADNAAL